LKQRCERASQSNGGLPTIGIVSWFHSWFLRQRQTNTRISVSRWLLAVFVGWQLAACSLTKDQLSTVKAFSDAAKNYSSAGSDLFTADADVFLARESFEAAAIDNPEKLWKKVNDVRGDYEREVGLAAKLKIAMHPLAIYSHELQQFASTDFTSDNDKAAKNLGDNFNKAIDSANKTFGTNLAKQSIGTTITYTVEYLGDIYIKYRQAEETKLVVAETSNTIKTLTDKVKSLAQEIQKESLGPADGELKSAIHTLSSSQTLDFSRLERPTHRRGLNQQQGTGSQEEEFTPHILSPSDSMALLHAAIQLDDATRLAKSLIDASDSCATANEKMLRALNRPSDVGDAIAEIEGFQAKTTESENKATK
jgi:hypothetical protein